MLHVDYIITYGKTPKCIGLSEESGSDANDELEVVSKKRKVFFNLTGSFIDRH